MNFYRFPVPIESALTDYRLRYGKFPTHITVNLKQVAAASQAAQRLSVAPVIKSSGGCLVGEVWLNMPEDKCQDTCQDTCQDNGNGQLKLFE